MFLVTTDHLCYLRAILEDCPCILAIKSSISIYISQKASQAQPDFFEKWKQVRQGVQQKEKDNFKNLCDYIRSILVKKDNDHLQQKGTIFNLFGETLIHDFRSIRPIYHYQEYQHLIHPILRGLNNSFFESGNNLINRGIPDFWVNNIILFFRIMHEQFFLPSWNAALNLHAKISGSIVTIFNKICQTINNNKNYDNDDLEEHKYILYIWKKIMILYSESWTVSYWKIPIYQYQGQYANVFVANVEVKHIEPESFSLSDILFIPKFIVSILLKNYMFELKKIINNKAFINTQSTYTLNGLLQKMHNDMAENYKEINKRREKIENYIDYMTQSGNPLKNTVYGESKEQYGGSTLSAYSTRVSSSPSFKDSPARSPLSFRSPRSPLLSLSSSPSSSLYRSPSHSHISRSTIPSYSGMPSRLSKTTSMINQVNITNNTNNTKNMTRYSENFVQEYKFYEQDYQTWRTAVLAEWMNRHSFVLLSELVHTFLQFVMQYYGTHLDDKTYFNENNILFDVTSDILDETIEQKRLIEENINYLKSVLQDVITYFSTTGFALNKELTIKESETRPLESYERIFLALPFIVRNPNLKRYIFEKQAFFKLLNTYVYYIH